jgi:biopolymer transport protein ExbB
MPSFNVRTRPAAAVLFLMALGAGALVTLSLADARRAAAQDDDVMPDEAADTAPAAAPAPATPSAAPPDAPPAAKKSYLTWLLDSLGIGYSITFLVLSFTLVALFVMNVIAARRDNVLPAELIEGFEAHLNSKQYQQAYELAKNDESFLGKVLSAGLAKLSVGYGPALEAMQEVGEDEAMKLEHRLSYMALIGTISPMVGLLGTVQGMIASFDVIATSTTAPKPSDLAAGIATALFTTLMGLLIAIPALGAYGILRNRVERLVLEVGIVSESLMSRFQNVGAKKPEA